MRSHLHKILTTHVLELFPALYEYSTMVDFNVNFKSSKKQETSKRKCEKSDNIFRSCKIQKNASNNDNKRKVSELTNENLDVFLETNTNKKIKLENRGYNLFKSVSDVSHDTRKQIKQTSFQRSYKDHEKGISQANKYRQQSADFRPESVHESKVKNYDNHFKMKKLKEDYIRTYRILLIINQKKKIKSKLTY